MPANAARGAAPGPPPAPPPPARAADPADLAHAFKRNATEYLVWALNVCLLGGGCTGLFVDFVPSDGVLRTLTPLEERMLGQSVERTLNERVRPKGTVLRLPCSAQTTPEVFYTAVLQAVRVNALARQKAAAAMAEAAADPALPPPPPASVVIPHFLVLQDVERAPARTLACLEDIMTTQLIATPGSGGTGFGPSGQEGIRLPTPFIVVATSCRLPRPSAMTTLYSAGVDARTGDCALPDRLLASFMMRIPILLPREPPRPSAAAAPQTVGAPPPPSQDAAGGGEEDAAAARQGAAASAARAPITPTNTQAAKAVHVSHRTSMFIRDLVSAARVDPLVDSGPSPFAPDVLLLAARNCAALRGSRFVSPLDLALCVVEVLAHRVVVAPPRDPSHADGALHPVLVARAVIAAAYARLPPLR